MIDYEIRRTYHALRALKVEHDLALDILANALDLPTPKGRMDLAHHLMTSKEDPITQFYQTLRQTQEEGLSVRKTCDAMGFGQFRYYSEIPQLDYDFVGGRDVNLYYIKDSQLKPLKEMREIVQSTKIL